MSMVIWLTVLVLFTAAPYTAQVVAVHDGNDAAYQLENAVLAGTTPVPTREEFIAALPVLGWAL